MSQLGSAILVVLKHEGGWVCNPRDPGGETNFGISTSFINENKITNEELELPPGRPLGWLKNLSSNVAVKIYRIYFWDKYGYDRINDQNVATKIFDASVNIGPPRSHIRAQRVVGATEDGILGPASFLAINKANPPDYMQAFGDQLRDYYTELVANKPGLHEFLGNWLKRASWGLQVPYTAT